MSTLYGKLDQLYEYLDMYCGIFNRFRKLDDFWQERLAIRISRKYSLVKHLLLHITINNAMFLAKRRQNGRWEFIRGIMKNLT